MRVHFLFQIASKPTTIFHEKISHSSTFSKHHWKNFAFSLAPLFKWDKILNSIMSSIDNCCSPFLRWKNGQNDTHSNFLLTKILFNTKFECVCLLSNVGFFVYRYKYQKIKVSVPQINDQFTSLWWIPENWILSIRASFKALLRSLKGKSSLLFGQNGGQN